MNIGIGLGAFMGSFSQGYGMGKQVKSDWNERKAKKEQQEIYDENQKKFQEGLKTGEFDGNGFMDVFRSEVSPKMRDYLIKNGKVKEVLEWDEWSNSSKGEEYAKLYGNARFQLGTKNYHGLANSLNEMLKSAGMGDNNVSYMDGVSGGCPSCTKKG